METNNLPFGDNFREAWKEWLEYRRQARYKSYTEIGLRKAFTELKRLSEDDEEIAIKMLDRAIANNWQGFNFKLPYDETNRGDTKIVKSNNPKEAGTNELLKQLGFK